MQGVLEEERNKVRKLTKNFDAVIRENYEKKKIADRDIEKQEVEVVEILETRAQTSIQPDATEKSVSEEMKPRKRQRTPKRIAANPGKPTTSPRGTRAKTLPSVQEALSTNNDEMMKESECLRKCALQRA